MRYTPRIVFLLYGLFAVLPLTGKVLRIATYNVHNYLSVDRLVDSHWRPGYPKPEAEKRALRRTILSVRPDVLAVQEIGSPAYLKELQADLAAGGLFLPYSAQMVSTDGQRNTALLSRIPIYNVIHHENLLFKYFGSQERVERGLLEVDLMIDTSPRTVLRLFVLHLKSKYSKNPEDPDSAKWRLSEAEACRNRILQRTVESGIALYCIAGDFNDHPKSATLRRFYQRGDLLFGRHVPAADDRGEVWTHFYKKHSVYSAIDGFVCSPDLFKWIAGGKGSIVGDLAGSDHRMVYIDLHTSQ